MVLQPEEWVRQNCVSYLINDKGYPPSIINVEKTLIINGLRKRYDVVIYNSDGSIFMIVECKRTDQKISQDTFDQIARYNLALDAQYLFLTNGLDHYFCQMDFDNSSYRFLKEIPNFTR